VTSPGNDATCPTRPASTGGRRTASAERAFTPAPVISPRRSSDDVGDTRSFLTVVSSRSNQALVLTVVGSIDLDTAPSLRRALELALVTSPVLMVVDLSEVPLLACAGLSVLVAARRRAEGRTCLRVAAPRRATRRSLALTGVDRYLSVYRTCAEALAEPVHGDRGESPSTVGAVVGSVGDDGTTP